MLCCKQHTRPTCWLPVQVCSLLEGLVGLGLLWKEAMLSASSSLKAVRAVCGLRRPDMLIAVIKQLLDYASTPMLMISAASSPD